MPKVLICRWRDKLVYIQGDPQFPTGAPGPGRWEMRSVYSCEYEDTADISVMRPGVPFIEGGGIILGKEPVLTSTSTISVGPTSGALYPVDELDIGYLDIPQDLLEEYLKRLKIMLEDQARKRGDRPIDKDKDSKGWDDPCDYVNGKTKEAVEMREKVKCKNESDRNTILQALKDICSNWKTIKDKLDPLRGCSDFLDQFIQCITSNMQQRVASIDCGKIGEKGDNAFGLTDKFTNEITIDIDSIKNLFPYSNKQQLNEILQQVLFHEMMHICGNSLMKNNWGRDDYYFGDLRIVDELEIRIINKIIFGDTYYLDKDGKKFYLNRIEEGLLNRGFFHINDNDADFKREFDSGQFAGSLENIKRQFSGDRYKIGGMFIWDSITGDVFCWNLIADTYREIEVKFLKFRY